MIQFAIKSHLFVYFLFISSCLCVSHFVFVYLCLVLRLPFALLWIRAHDFLFSATEIGKKPTLKTTLTNNRGVSGFDSLGHGHYFASYPNSHGSSAQPSLPQNNPHQQAPPRPFQQQSGHHESSGQPHHSQHNSYDSDSLSGHGGSIGHGSSSSGGGSGGGNSNKGSYGGNWNYINSNDRNSVHGHQGYNSQSADKDTPQR